MHNRLKVLCLAIIFLIPINTNAFGQTESQFVIQGLYVGMSMNEFQTNFDGSGYNCKKLDTPSMKYFDCEHSALKHKWARMFVDEDGLASGYRLRCGVTNSCKFNVNEIVSLLKTAGRFPDSTIEEKTEQNSETKIVHRRVFITPTSLMDITCRSWDLYDHCTIHVNGNGKYRYPKF